MRERFYPIACGTLDGSRRSPAPTPLPAPTTETNALEPTPELKPSQRQAAICRSYCAWQSRCPAEEANDCQADCDALFARKAPKQRSSFVKAAAECFDTAACEDGEDTCFYVHDDGASLEEEKTCLDRRGQCPGTPSFYEEYCRVLPSYEEGTRQQAAACLYQLCDDIPACLKKALY